MLCQFGLDVKARLGVTRSCCGVRTLRRTFFRDAMGAGSVFRDLGIQIDGPVVDTCALGGACRPAGGWSKGKPRGSRGQEVKRATGELELELGCSGI